MYNQKINKELTTNGFYVSQLSDEVKNKIRLFLPKIKNSIFSEAIHTGCGNTDSSFDSFSNLEKIKLEYAPLKKWQFWYQCTNFRKNISHEEFEFLDKIFYEIISSAYPIDTFDTTTFINLTMFNKLCYINNHQDGESGMRKANILIYLNEDYKDGMGGELIINNTTKITPEFGTVVIIDFKTINPTHAVTEVIDDSFKRYALIAGFNNFDKTKKEYL